MAFLASTSRMLVASRPPAVLSARCIVARAIAHPERPATQLRSPEDASSSLYPVPQDLLDELASHPGVRVVVEDPEQDYMDDDDEVEDWEDVMAELTDPWMAKPGAASNPLEDLFQEQQQQESRSQPDVKALTSQLQPPAAAEVQDLQDQQSVRALLSQEPQLIVLDVRSEEEFMKEHIPGSISCPIRNLTGDSAKNIASRVVLVLGTGDYKGSQACIRLTKVYGALDVYYYEPGVAGWPEGLTA